jgi:hypothetical protein
MEMSRRIQSVVSLYLTSKLKCRSHDEMPSSRRGLKWIWSRRQPPPSGIYRIHPLQYDDGQLSRSLSWFERSGACPCLRIHPVKLVLAAMQYVESGSKSGFDTDFSRHRRTELDSCRLTTDIPVASASVRWWSKTIMKYLRLSRVGVVLPASTSNLSIENVFKWVKIRVESNFSRQVRVSPTTENYGSLNMRKR